MKKLTSILLTVLLALTITTVRVRAEEEVVTKYTPNTLVQNGKLTISHPEFLMASQNATPETYSYRITVNGVSGETLPYTPNQVITYEVYDTDVYSTVIVAFYAHYKDGKPFTTQQLGQTRVNLKAFDWNWEYEAPGCDGLKVDFPKDLPHDAIDVNIRIKNLETGEVKTINFRNEDGSKLNNGETVVFDVRDYVDWEYFEYQWVQVHGTNYHWEGSVICGEPKEETSIPLIPLEPSTPIDKEEPTKPETPKPSKPEPEPEVEVETEEVPEVEVQSEVETTKPETLPNTGVPRTTILPMSLTSLGLFMLAFNRKKKDGK